MEIQQLLAGLTVLLVLGGCLSGSAGHPPSPTPTLTPTPAAATNTPKPTSPTATAMPDGHERAANQPDPDKAVLLKSEWNQSVTMRVRVIREATNTPVHNETYHLKPGVEQDVYHTTAADPNGVEEFTVVVTARNTTERAIIKTNDCYGPAYVEIREDGSLYLYYAIC